MSAGKVDVPCDLCGGCMEVMLPCPACQGAAAIVGKAGVLTELDSLLEWLDHDGYDIEAARIRAVRAAVAKLAEAARGVLDDDSAQTSLADQRARWNERMDALRAALARVQP